LTLYRARNGLDPISRGVTVARKADSDLSHRRVLADLGDGVPDGICFDADDAVWYSDIPNKRRVRVREGGEVLQTATVDRGCFACVLGGEAKKTLYIIATEWRGMDKIAEVDGF
jgi:sugar lactone lactonase YvrE